MNLDLMQSCQLTFTTVHVRTCIIKIWIYVNSEQRRITIDSRQKINLATAVAVHPSSTWPKHRVYICVRTDQWTSLINYLPHKHSKTSHGKLLLGQALGWRGGEQMTPKKTKAILKVNLLIASNQISLYRVYKHIYHRRALPTHTFNPGGKIGSCEGSYGLKLSPFPS